MGFDMRHIKPLDDAEQIALDAAKDQTEAALRDFRASATGTPERKESYDRLMAASDQYVAARVNYQQFNNYGMGVVVGFMEDRGMAYDAPRTLSWPEYPAYDEDSFEEHKAAQAKYDELARPTLIEHPEGGDSIPSFKLDSNDGWIVTAAECAAAVAANAQHDPPTYLDEDSGEKKPITWWPDWVAFLERGAAGEGFTVK